MSLLVSKTSSLTCTEIVADNAKDTCICAITNPACVPAWLTKSSPVLCSILRKPRLWNIGHKVNTSQCVLIPYLGFFLLHLNMRLLLTLPAVIHITWKPVKICNSCFCHIPGVIFYREFQSAALLSVFMFLFGWVYQPKICTKVSTERALPCAISSFLSKKKPPCY